jgi:hypothetical protein
MRCKECVFRQILICDKHGEIPWYMVERDIECPDFKELEKADTVLRRWLVHAPESTIERQYIESMLAAIWLKPLDCRTLDSAVKWVYELPDGHDVRALRDTVSIQVLIEGQFRNQFDNARIPF